MSVNPTPYIIVADLYVRTGPDPIPGAADGLVAIDALKIPWGRKSLLDQPTPSTCTVTIRDTSTGATFARRRDLKGQGVVIGWTTATASGITFQGRITDVAVRPRTRGRPGFVVTLSCSSREVDAANYRAPEGTSWPVETARDRLGRIVALMPDGLFPEGVQAPTRDAVGLTDVAYPELGDFLDYPVAAVDVGGQDALSLLRGLWRSLAPVPLIYDPQANGLLFIRSRLHSFDPNAGGTVVGRLVASPAAGGRYVVRPYTLLALSLDSNDVPLGGPLAQPLESMLTRVEVKYRDPSTGEDGTVATLVAGAPSEDVAGRRTLSVDSILAHQGLAQQLANQWATLAGQVALPAIVDPLTYRVTKLGGFADDDAAAIFLAGRERPAELYLGRSWITRLGALPLFGIIGGTISYAGGEWELQLQTAPVKVDYPIANPVTANTSANSAAITLANLDDSVSVGDMANVHIGAGYTYSTQPWG